MGISWGIIGCGNVTEVKSGPAFNKVPGSTLAAVMRRDAEKAKAYAARHHVPMWYADANELINDPKVNAIYVATPPDSHERYVLSALQAGKPVYVEKPMSTDLASCIRMADAAASTGVALTVAHYRRAVPMFVKIKELIHAGAVGDIRTVRLSMLQPDQSALIASTETNWRVDPAVGGLGGLFYDLAPHQLDLMLHFFGAIAESKGMSTNQAGLYEVRDIVSGLIHFENGILFNGTWCFTVAEELKEDLCEVIGSKGKISFPMFGNTVHVQKGSATDDINFIHPEHIQQPMIEKVVQYFLGKGENPCTADEAVLSFQLMEKFVLGE